MFHNEENRSNGSVSVGCLNTISDWVETLHGSGELAESLQSIVDVVRADVAMLQRLVPERLALTSIATADPSAHKVPAPRRRSFAREMLGDHLNVMKVGTLITLVEAEKARLLDHDAIITLRTQMSALNLRDVAVLRLSDGPKGSDFLELHFAGDLPHADRNLIAILGPTLANTWGVRLPGTAEKSIQGNKIRSIGHKVDPAKVAILDAANPLALTRCEYRVCVLVREGMLVKSIARKLDVQEPTIRSHMRSIYLKTGTGCHVELLHRLSTEAQQANGTTEPVETDVEQVSVYRPS